MKPTDLQPAPILTHLSGEFEAIRKALAKDNTGRADRLCRTAIRHIANNPGADTTTRPAASTAILRLLGQISRMKRDGEYYDSDGNLLDPNEHSPRVYEDLEPYTQESDDAVETLSGIIRQARELCAVIPATTDPQPRITDPELCRLHDELSTLLENPATHLFPLRDAAVAYCTHMANLIHP